MQEKIQTAEDQQLEFFPPSRSAETIQNTETDTSPVKSLTVLQNACPGTNNNGNSSQKMERVPPEVINPEGSVGSSGGTDVNVYFEEKLRLPSEREIQTLVEVSEESIAKILGGPIVSERVVDESIRNDVVGDLEERGQ